MVNMAEKVHRIRRRRAYLRDATVPQPFGFIDICQKLKAQGVDADEIERALATIKIQPVFTAHPTEVTRRTLLRKEHSIARYLVDMMDPYLTPNELEAMLGKVRQEMTTGWQTAERPEESVRLRDEAEHVLFFLTDVLYRMVPPFYENLESALAGAFADRGTRIRVPIARAIRHMGWRGHGRQSPHHGEEHSPDARSAALARARSVLPRVHSSAGQLSQGADRVRVSEELERRAQMYAGHFPEAAAALPIRHRRMPYRVFLRLVGARLRATYDDAAFPYESPDEFVADIELVADSLRAHKGRSAGLWSVRRLLAAGAHVRVPHGDRRHSTGRPRASARDRGGVAGAAVAHARRRRAGAPARGGARAARIAARRSVVRRSSYAGRVPDHRALPA